VVKYLNFKDQKTDKFWTIKVHGASYTVRYGKTGSKGTEKTKYFENEEAALKDGQKLLAAKVKKGYVELKPKSSVQSSKSKATTKTKAKIKTSEALPVVLDQETQKVHALLLSKDMAQVDDGLDLMKQLQLVDVTTFVTMLVGYLRKVTDRSSFKRGILPVIKKLIALHIKSEGTPDPVKVMVKARHDILMLDILIHQGIDPGAFLETAKKEWLYYDNHLSIGRAEIFPFLLESKEDLDKIEVLVIENMQTELRTSIKDVFPYLECFRQLEKVKIHYNGNSKLYYASVEYDYEKLGDASSIYFQKMEMESESLTTMLWQVLEDMVLLPGLEKLEFIFPEMGFEEEGRFIDLLNKRLKKQSSIKELSFDYLDGDLKDLLEGTSIEKLTIKSGSFHCPDNFVPVIQSLSVSGSSVPMPLLTSKRWDFLDIHFFNFDDKSREAINGLSIQAKEVHISNEIDCSNFQNIDRLCIHDISQLRHYRDQPKIHFPSDQTVTVKNVEIWESQDGIQKAQLKLLKGVENLSIKIIESKKNLPKLLAKLPKEQWNLKQVNVCTNYVRYNPDNIKEKWEKINF